MKSPLVVYYSFEGSTRFMAEEIARSTGASILELKTFNENKNTNKLIQYFWGGKQVLFKEKPQLKEFNLNPQDFNTIFIGTPVWAGTFAPVIRTFLESKILKDKEIFLFCCHEGAQGNVFQNMKKKLSENKVISQKDFCNVSKDKNNALQEMKAWLDKLDHNFSR